MGIDYTHKKYGGEWGGNLISRPGKTKYREITKGPQTGQTKTEKTKLHGMIKESGAPGTNRKLHVKSSKRLNEIMRLKEKKRQTRTGPGTEEARKKRLSHLQSGGYKAGGRAGVRPTRKYVPDVAKTAQHPHSRLKTQKELKKITDSAEYKKSDYKKQTEMLGGKVYAKGGRAGFRGGGRTNLLEELGRVEAEPSNRNRRAEISRVHGELNRGYKHGKRVKKQHGGSAQSHYVQHGYGPHRSSGKVLKGKKVGIQIK